MDNYKKYLEQQIIMTKRLIRNKAKAYSEQGLKDALKGYEDKLREMNQT
jgi:hypothetical protein